VVGECTKSVASAVEDARAIPLSHVPPWLGWPIYRRRTEPIRPTRL
jgi:hypothetical protein